MFLRFAAVVLGFISAFALRATIELWSPQEKLKEVATVHDVMKYDDSQISRVLFIDSVLTIVGNYYVDPAKTSSDKLLEAIFSGLTRQGWLRYKKEGRSLELESRGHKKSWFLEDDTEGEKLAYLLLEISQFLQEGERSQEDGSEEGVESALDNRIQHVLNTMLTELDPHSAVLSREEYHDLKQGTEGVFGGLGVLVGVREGQLTVINPLPNSPASKAGIRRFDRILSIDDVSTFGYELDDLVTHMRGLPGSKVKVRLLRQGAQSPQWVTLTREMIQVDAVTSKVVFSENRVPALVLVVDSFSNHTVAQARSELFEFHKKFGRDKGVILDLRGNPGGLLDQAVRLSDLFLGHGLVVSTRGRLVESEFSRSEFGEEDFPVAVLIDGESASASEIVAAALQDRKRAVVIGQISFGKGSVQTIFELPEERALKLTIARYYTPKDRSLQNHGVEPDILMQAVFRDKENKNLLGPGRYRKENFLQRFTTGDQSHSWEDQEAYFYLMDSHEVGEYSDRSYDHELRFAVHWVENQKKAIKSLEKSTEESVSYLSDLGVEWLSSGCSAKALGLKLNTKIPQVEYASHMKVPFQVRNKTSEPCDQVSVFIHADDPRLEPMELLVGRVQPGEVRTGELEVWVPGWVDPGDLHYSVGLAVSGRMYGAFQHQKALVVGRELGKIEHIVQFDDSAFGAVEGFLEDKEEAMLDVIVTNKSQHKIVGLHSDLFNLAGKQIELALDPSAESFELSPGETKTLHHKVTGNKISNEEISVGVIVTSDHVQQPIMEEFSIRALVRGQHTAKSNIRGGVH